MTEQIQNTNATINTHELLMETTKNVAFFTSEVLFKQGGINDDLLLSLHTGNVLLESFFFKVVFKNTVVSEFRDSTELEIPTLTVTYDTDKNNLFVFPSNNLIVITAVVNNSTKRYLASYLHTAKSPGSNVMFFNLIQSSSIDKGEAEDGS